MFGKNYGTEWRSVLGTCRARRSIIDSARPIASRGMVCPRGQAGKNRFGDLHSSRRNARLILQHWNEDQGWIEEYLCIPCVLVFAGHMIDRPDRATPRFPSEFESAVAKEIQRNIDMFQPGVGFASAAFGSGH